MLHVEQNCYRLKVNLMSKIKRRGFLFGAAALMVGMSIPLSLAKPTKKYHASSVEIYIDGNKVEGFVEDFDFVIEKQYRSIADSMGLNVKQLTENPNGKKTIH